MHEMNTPEVYKVKIIDTIGITLLGILCFLYCVFEINFAELNIQLPFLNFPIFIGEIILAICVSVLIVRWIACRQKFNFWHYILFLYIGFVLLKALYGYLKWGPLALRHSALFYYPLFALFGYVFFRQEYFKKKQNIIIISALLFASILLAVNTRYKFICFILAFLLIWSYPKKNIRFSFLFLFVIFTPYIVFLRGMRAMWLSNVVSIIFIIVTLMSILKLKKSLKIALCMLFLFVLCLNSWKVLDKSLPTIIDVRENIRRFQEYNNFVSLGKKYFIMYDMDYARLYNKGRYVDDPLAEKDIRVRDARKKMQAQQQILIGIIDRKLAESQKASHMQEQAGSAQPFQEPTFLMGKLELKNNRQNNYSGRDLTQEYGTNLFRIFIWKDALEELFRLKPLLGFDFGKPFRSKNIEILNAGFGEWSRDGWIAMHNSYIEIVYRFGIVGIILILFIFSILFTMIKIALRSKSFSGLLLCGALINWLIAANFMIILELPYSAIPFWSLFGMTLSYLTNLENKVNFQITGNKI